MGLAIFDVDRTLLPGSSLVCLAMALRDRGVVSYRHVAVAAARGAVFARWGEANGTADRVCHQALAALRGTDVDTLRGAVVEAAGIAIAAVRPAVRELVEGHLAAGDQVVLLSASPDELVQLVAHGLGAHVGVGTRVELRDGRLTGRLDGPLCHGAGKLARLRDTVGDTPLDCAYAYADAASDLPLLTRAGFPRAVTPDRALRAIALERGWPIYDAVSRSAPSLRRTSRALARRSSLPV